MPNEIDLVLEAKFKELLQQYPNMTAQGLGVDPQSMPNLTVQQITALERQRLEQSLDAFKLAYGALVDFSRGDVAAFARRDS